MHAPLVVALLFALAGCGGDDSIPPAAEGGATTSTQGAVTAPDTTPSVTTDAEQATSDPTAPEPTMVTIVIKGGTPVGGIKRVSLKKGDKVVLVVRSDTADEIHLHGYDLSRDVAAGGVARIPFVASVPGRFEAELEALGVQLAELTVTP